VTKSLIPADASSKQIDTMVRERVKSDQALYALDLDCLRQLEPELIVTQALCDVCAVAESEIVKAVETLPRNPRVINLEPSCLEDVFAGIQQVANATDCEHRGEAYVTSLRQRMQTVANRSETILHRPTTMLLEWIDPPFSAGHWSPELVHLAGGREVIGVAGQRSITIPWDTIVAADPEVLIIACCGYDVKRALQDIPILSTYQDWTSLSSVKAGQVYVVDGSAYFSRPGPRLLDSLEILAHTLHPAIHPLPAGLPPATAVNPSIHW
jgi:iron complex transport system substrate-binding protein